MQRLEFKNSSRKNRIVINIYAKYQTFLNFRIIELSNFPLLSIQAIQIERHGDTMIHCVAILNTIWRKFETSYLEKHQWFRPKPGVLLREFFITLPVIFALVRSNTVIGACSKIWKPNRDVLFQFYICL